MINYEIHNSEIRKYLNRRFEGKGGKSRKQTKKLLQPYFGLITKQTKKKLRNLCKELCKEIDLALCFSVCKIGSFTIKNRTLPTLKSFLSTNTFVLALVPTILVKHWLVRIREYLKKLKTCIYFHTQKI